MYEFIQNNFSAYSDAKWTTLFLMNTMCMCICVSYPYGTEKRHSHFVSCSSSEKGILFPAEKRHIFRQWMCAHVTILIRFIRFNRLQKQIKRFFPSTRCLLFYLFLFCRWWPSRKNSIRHLNDAIKCSKWKTCFSSLMWYCSKHYLLWLWKENVCTSKWIKKAPLIVA